MQRTESAIRIYKAVCSERFSAVERLEYQYMVANLTRFVQQSIYDAALNPGVIEEEWDQLLAREINFILAFREQVTKDFNTPKSGINYPLHMHDDLIDKLTNMAMAVGLYLSINTGTAAVVSL